MSFDRMASVRDFFTARVTPVENIAPPLPPPVVVLRDHRKFVTDVVELKDGRLASASEDRTIRVWRLDEDGTADGRPELLTGHTEAVRCLVALDDGRLASGSRDKTVRIWDLSGKTPCVVLRGHEGFVWKLAPLADNRLASGAWDKTLRIWDLSGDKEPLVIPHGDVVRGMLTLKDGRLVTGGGKDGMINVWTITDKLGCTKTLELASHPDYVAALAELPDGKLAAGGGKAGAQGEGFHIRIWDLDQGPTQTPMVLRGHADVWSLVALDDGRLTSGGPDGIRVWDLDHAERRPFGFAGQSIVDGMAVLEDGSLVTGGIDGTVYIRKVKLFAYYSEIMNCSPEVAKKWFEQDRIGELFDAAVLQYDELLTIDDEEAAATPGDVASLSVITQARNFDAIALTLNGATSTRRDNAIDALAPRVLRLIRDEELLLTFEQRLVSKNAIEQLTSSPLFRVVLNAKFAAGAQFVLWLDILLFTVLFVCFTRLAGVEINNWGAWFRNEKAVDIVAGFVVLAYFSFRELLQMYWDRRRELAVRHSDALKRFFALLGKAKLPPLFMSGRVALRSLGRILWYVVTSDMTLLQKASLMPRVLLAIVCLVLYLPVSCLPGRSVKAFCFGSVPSVLFNTVTSCGLPSNWRWNLWNWVEVAMLSFTWTAFVRAAVSRIPVNLAVACAFLLWFEVFDYLRHNGINEELASFVLMIGQIFLKLAVFMCVFVLILMMFTHVFYLRFGSKKIKSFDLHDDAPNYIDHPYHSLLKSFYSVLLLAFAQTYDPDIYYTTIDRIIFVFYLFIIVIVLLNVLIAIVNSQYEDTSARAEKLFYRGRFELVTETSDFLRLFRGRRNQHNEKKKDVAAMIKYELSRGSVHDIVGSHDDAAWQRAQRETDAKLEAMDAKLEALRATMDAKMDLILSSLASKS